MNNEEKILALLEQLTQGQADTNKRLDNMETRMSAVEDTLESVRTSQLKVELEQYPRISAALDGVVGAIQKDKEQDTRILVLENKVDRHDVELAYLKAK